MDAHRTAHVPNGREWVEEVLAPSALGRALLPFVLDGRWAAIAPRHLPAERMHKFRMGGIFDREPEYGGLDALRTLVEVILQHLDQGPRRLTLLYDMSSRPSDPWLRTQNAKFFQHDDVVYHFARHGDSQAEIRARLRDAEYMPYFFGAVGRLEGQVPDNGGELEKDHLTRFAESTSRVFVSVYDSETFLLLERNSDND